MVVLGEKRRDSATGLFASPGGGVRKQRRKFKGNCGWRGCERGNNDPTAEAFGQKHYKYGLCVALKFGVEKSPFGGFLNPELNCSKPQVLNKYKKVYKYKKYEKT